MSTRIVDWKVQHAYSATALELALNEMQRQGREIYSIDFYVNENESGSSRQGFPPVGGNIVSTLPQNLTHQSSKTLLPNWVVISYKAERIP